MKSTNPTSTSDSQSVRLLLVDDDPEFRNMTARNFGRRGYSVHEADCGEVALAMFKQYDFDVVILDVSMPDMPGIEVLEQLKNSDADAEVIMLTGETTIKTAVEAMKLGAINYLTKPVEMDELIVVVEKALHQASLVADKPMVVINCAALSEHLLESELFGHEKGSFTEATVSKEGLFEFADGGTLFIDEIGEMAGSLQAKMLRVLEDGSLRRVGATKERKVNVRIITATNRDMQKEVDVGRFREDLFYRIDVMTLRVPSLRDRTGDIPLLIKHFAGDEWEVSLEALEAMKKYSWPGNVRQLINSIERAKILANEAVIHLKNLPPAIAEAVSQPSTKSTTPFSESPADQAEIDLVQREHVVSVLWQSDGIKARAARSLGVSRHTLYRILEKLDIALDKREFQIADQE